jgi:hypothetical protein
MLCITIAFQSDHHSELFSNTIAKTDQSIEANRLAHRSLNVQRLDILPVLLQQGDEEVDA